MTWFARTRLRRHEASRLRRDLAHLNGLPDYLLRDMGLSLDGEAARARQLRAETRR